MPEMQINNAPKSFWVIAVFAVLWNLAGVGAYLSDVTMGEEALAALSEAERNLRDATPVWVTGAYAVAVFSGLLAALALLARKSWAVPLFGVALLAVVLQMGFVFIGLNAARILGASAMAFPAFIIAAGLFLLLYAVNVNKKGWLQ